MSLTLEEIDFITDAVVKRIQDKYFLVEKTFDLRVDDVRKQKEIAAQNFVGLIISKACEHFDVSQIQLINGRARPHDCNFNSAEIRFMLFNMCIELPEEKMTLYAIARHFDKDHATVVNGIARHQELFRFNKTYANSYNAIVGAVNEAMRVR